MTPAVVLNKAADLIEERGWFQGNIRDDDKRLCANIALSVAAEVRGDLMQGEGASERYALYTQAQVALLKHLDIQPELGRVRGEAVICWNDTPGRTLSEVATAMRAAAKEAT